MSVCLLCFFSFFHLFIYFTEKKCDVPLVVCTSLSGGGLIFFLSSHSTTFSFPTLPPVSFSENKSYLLSLMQFLKSNLESNMCGAIVLHLDSQVDCSPQAANMIARVREYISIFVYRDVKKKQYHKNIALFVLSFLLIFIFL